MVSGDFMRAYLNWFQVLFVRCCCISMRKSLNKAPSGCYEGIRVYNGFFEDDFLQPNGRDHGLMQMIVDDLYYSEFDPMSAVDNFASNAR